MLTLSRLQTFDIRFIWYCKGKKYSNTIEAIIDDMWPFTITCNLPNCMPPASCAVNGFAYLANAAANVILCATLMLTWVLLSEICLFCQVFFKFLILFALFTEMTLSACWYIVCSIMWHGIQFDFFYFLFSLARVLLLQVFFCSIWKSLNSFFNGIFQKFSNSIWKGVASNCLSILLKGVGVWRLQRHTSFVKLIQFVKKNKN